ncbi:MAG: transketolase, partial [Candidatus Omnitrophota bacterium]
MASKINKTSEQFLKSKAAWLRKETLKIHKTAPETRLASSLSGVEIFTVLYYGGILRYKASDTHWEGRDRFIVSKGHGAISLYPVLAERGFFSAKELSRVCKEGSFLGGIPDPVIPGFETVNGSLGHGLGVACGMAIALKSNKRKEMVFVLSGDGELSEGSVWEAIMFAGARKLDNLVFIVDNNKISMLDYCRNIVDIEPLEEKFRVFQWAAQRVDGHNPGQLYRALKKWREQPAGKPKVLIADTVKGKGAPSLENDPLCHIKNLTTEQIDALIG